MGFAFFCFGILVLLRKKAPKKGFSKKIYLYFFFGIKRFFFTFDKTFDVFSVHEYRKQSDKYAEHDVGRTRVNEYWKQCPKLQSSRRTDRGKRDYFWYKEHKNKCSESCHPRANQPLLQRQARRRSPFRPWICNKAGNSVPEHSSSPQRIFPICWKKFYVRSERVKTSLSKELCNNRRELLSPLFATSRKKHQKSVLTRTARATFVAPAFPLPCARTSFWSAVFRKLWNCWPSRADKRVFRYKCI